MPTAAPHPCGNPRCRHLAPKRKRYCASCEVIFEHARYQEDRRRRGSSNERGYGAAWQALREQILERDRYLCRYCANLGRDLEASLVDHVRSKEHGGSDEPTNLASCCKNCHSEKSTKHDGWWGRTPNPIDRIEQFLPSWHLAGGWRGARGAA